MSPACRTAILECPAEQRSASNLAWVQNAAGFSTTLMRVLPMIKKDRMKISVFLITHFMELTLLKLVGPVCIETNLGNDL
jgi:hypothetical protein